MKMKNSFIIGFALILMIGILSACGDSSNESKGNSDKFPEKAITLIVPWSAGGGTDTGARILQPYLEEELGQTVTVVNKTGGGGWVGWNELANAKPDGYTIGYANSPHIITGYLNPELKRDKDLDDFTALGMHVIDPDTISVREDEDRFTTMEELIEYAKEHPLTATATGEGTDEHLVILNMNKKYGTKFEPVHFDGAAETHTAVLGKHVDVLVGNLGEILSLNADGKINVLGVAAKERSEFLPDVPTLDEQGFEIYQESSRGLLGPKDMDPEVVEKIRTALKKAIENEEHIDKMADLGFGVHYEDGDAYMDVLKEDEQAVKELNDLLGW